MMIFNSVRNIILSFLLLVTLIAVLFWLYLNVQASMQVSAQNANIQLSDSLPTRIHVGNFLEAHAKGKLDTVIDIDKTLTLPLQGKYLANLKFAVETPITVDIDYQTSIKINTIMPLETTTDLVYQKKFLPKFPLKLDIPIQLEVPFHLKRSYRIPIQIVFDDQIYFDFDETIDLPIYHRFKPVLNLNDPIVMHKVSSFNATMYNKERDTIADLYMNLNLPLKNVHP